MTRLNLGTMSLEELVDRFRDAAFGLAGEVGSPKQYRKFFDRLNSITEELRRRGPDARRALLPLLECPESGPMWLRRERAAECRYQAAFELLAVEPARARETLAALANGWVDYQRAEARGTLKALEDGSFKPT